MNKQAWIAPNETGPTEVISIDEQRCIGCNACANICRTQTILQNPVKGQPPLLVYPDECWFCACCVEACPTGALQMRQPIGRRILFKRKETGEVFRIGQKNAPPKSFFRPPYGELREGKTRDLWIALNQKGRRTMAILPKSVCSEVAAKFQWENTPGKIISLLKDIGFDKVLEMCPAAVDHDSASLVVYFSAGQEPAQAEADLHYRSSDLCDIIKKACVSMYTAVHIWDELPVSAYDTACEQEQ